MRIHRSKDRPIERDRDGRRRYTPRRDGEPGDRACRAPEATKPPAASHRSQHAAKIVTAIENLRPGFSITRLTHWIVLSWGWRRALVAFGAGAVSALAMAPFDAWPVLFFTFPDSGVARRWRGGRPPRRTAERGNRRLVVRLRLFPRRPLLGRLRLSGRRQDLRLADAVRGRRAAGGHGLLHGLWPWPRAHALDARADAAHCARDRAHRRRVAARPSVQRLPLERLWLRAHRAAGAGAERGADRHLGPHLHRGRGVREPGGVDGRSHRYAAAMAAARARRGPARRACGLRRDAAVPHARPPLSKACGCGSCSPIFSRTRNSTTARSRR